MGTFEQKAQAALDAVLDAPTTPYGQAVAQIELANAVKDMAAELDRLKAAV